MPKIFEKYMIDQNPVTYTPSNMYFTLFILESALWWFKDQEGRPVNQVGYLDLDYNYLGLSRVRVISGRRRVTPRGRVNLPITPIPDKNMCIFFFFQKIQVLIIGNSEVDSVLSGQYFLTMTLHRKEHSNGENIQLPSL